MDLKAYFKKHGDDEAEVRKRLSAGHASAAGIAYPGGHKPEMLSLDTLRYMLFDPERNEIGTTGAPIGSPFPCSPSKHYAIVITEHTAKAHADARAWVQAWVKNRREKIRAEAFAEMVILTCSIGERFADTLWRKEIPKRLKFKAGAPKQPR
jgi:hypothetical protein